MIMIQLFFNDHNPSPFGSQPIAPGFVSVVTADGFYCFLSGPMLMKSSY